MTYFTVPEPVGYVRMTRGGKFSEKAERYHRFKQDVEWSARAAGLKLPLTATVDQPIFVVTDCRFRTQVSPDPENVQKGVVDALFYKAKGGDKHVAGFYLPAIYGVARNVVEIGVWSWNDKELDRLRRCISGLGR